MICAPLPRERGNVLFMILIAVALFAALSYAVTSSSRTGGGDASKESADTKAARLLSFAAQINQGVQRIRLIQGCDMDAITSGNNLFGNPATYPGKCNLFDQTVGGGVPYTTIKAGDASIYGDMTDASFPGKNFSIINSMNVKDIGTTNTDTILIIHNIRQEICKAINRKLGIEALDGDLPSENSPFEGGFSFPRPAATTHTNLTIGNNGSGDNELKGQLMGCYKATRSGDDPGWYFYSVLVAY